MALYVQFLRKTAATWTSDNTVLKAGQVGIETDTKLGKFGDGTTAWNSLGYMWDQQGTATGNVTGQASSVDSEIALFSSTTGKVIKRMTGSGLVKVASGVASTATAGTDYYNPGGTDVAITDGGTGVSTLPTGLLKGAGTGAITAAVSATDYAPATTGSAILKASSGGFAAAVAGTDYVAPLFLAQLTSTQSTNTSAAEVTHWTPANVSAGSLVANATLFQARLWGNFDNIATSGLLTGRLKINGTTIATIAIIGTSITSGQTVQPWFVDLDVYVDVTGSGGSVSVGGDAIVETTAGGGVNPRPAANIATAVNLVAGAQFTWTVQFATSNVGNVVRTARGVIQQVA